MVMEQTMTKNPLGYEKISSLLRRFAVPSIIAMLVSSLYNIVDQIFIGQGVGYLGNAATNVSYPLTTICLAIALLIGIGSASNFSLSLGAGDKEKAARVTGNAICMMFVFGIFICSADRNFSCADAQCLWLHSGGASLCGKLHAHHSDRHAAAHCHQRHEQPGQSGRQSEYSMTCMLIGAVINTILDPIFIFVFHLGVAGAAWATVIGQFFSFIFALMYIKKFKSITLKREHIRLSGKLCLTTATLGMSNSLNQLAITFVQIVMNNSLTYYGAMSAYGQEIPLAACGIVMKTNAILLAVIIGISQGSQPIVGFNYGARQYDRVKRTYKLAILCNVAVSAVGFILFEFFPRPIISIFGTGDAAYYEFAVKFMRIFLFMVIANGVQLISSNFFSAIGKPLKGMILSLTRQVFFLIPLLFILPLFFRHRRDYVCRPHCRWYGVYHNGDFDYP